MIGASQRRNYRYLLYSLHVSRHSDCAVHLRSCSSDFWCVSHMLVLELDGYAEHEGLDAS